MAANYIIRTEDNQTFCGWNQLGNMVIKNDPNYEKLGYRMTRTIAEKTKSKLEEYLNQPCLVVSVKA